MVKRQERLNDNDKRVLVEMSDERAQWIAAMAADTSLTPAQVRRSYRKLKRMGLAYFTTCWDEDNGRVAGSGYCLTSKGRDERDKLRAEGVGDS